jgi:hypothetical protein
MLGPSDIWESHREMRFPYPIYRQVMAIEGLGISPAIAVRCGAMRCGAYFSPHKFQLHPSPLSQSNQQSCPHHMRATSTSPSTSLFLSITQQHHTSYISLSPFVVVLHIQGYMTSKTSFFNLLSYRNENPSYINFS